MAIPLNIDMVWVRIRHNDPQNPDDVTYTLVDPVNNKFDLQIPVTSQLSDEVGLDKRYIDLISLIPISVYEGAPRELVSLAGGSGDTGSAELRMQLSDYANGGLPSKFDSGQDVTAFGNPNSSATPVFRNKGLGYPAGYTVAPSAGYVQGACADSVTELTVSWVFDPPTPTTTSGAAAFGAFSIPVRADTTGQQKSPMHMSIGTTIWQYGSFDDSHNFSIIAQGTFDTPLAADGVTVHTCTIVLDKFANTAYAWLPNNQIVKIGPHATLTIDAKYAFIEPFRYQAGDVYTRFVGTWEANSKSTDKLALAKTAYALQGKVNDLSVGAGGTATPTQVSNKFTNGTSTLYTPSTINVATDVVPGGVGPKIQCVAGPTGKVRVDVQCWIEIPISCYYILTMKPDSGPSILHLVTGPGVFNQTYKVSFLMESLPAGLRTFTLQHWEFDTGRPLAEADPGMRVNEPLGQRITLFAEPLA